MGRWKSEDRLGRLGDAVSAELQNSYPQRGLCRFWFIKDNQVPKKINLIDFEAELLALSGTGPDRNWNHTCQMLSVAGALSEKYRFSSGSR